METSTIRESDLLDYYNIQIEQNRYQMLLPEQLYANIPKKVDRWQAEEVQKWFSLNKIQTSNHFSFQKEKFDGKALLSVTPNYLMETCGVVSRIVMKKIIEWLEYDREDFEEYVDEHLGSQCASQATKTPREDEIAIETELLEKERPSKSQIIPQLQSIPQQNDRISTPRHMFDYIQKHSDAIKPAQVQKWKKKKRVQQQSMITEKVLSSKQNSKRESNKSSQNYIPTGANFVKSSYEVLESMIEFNVKSRTQLLNNSGKIGRHNANDIIVLDDSVSRKHAEIIKDKDDFYIRDTQSKFGTFIQIGKNRRNINEGDIIAFEDYQIQILKYKFYKSNNTFQLKIRKKAENDAIANFFNKKYILVGKESKDIAINDPNIFSSHARITFDSLGQLIIEELQGKCFRKLKKDELFRIDQADRLLRFGLLTTEIKLIKSTRTIPSISQFQFYKPSQ